MTRYSQVSARSLNAIIASKCNLLRQRCRSTVTISGCRENYRIRRLPQAKCLPNGVPVTLIIRSGLVWSDMGNWEGTVSPEGVLVMHFGTQQAGGQMDGQGIIRAQGRTTSGCAYAYVWQKESPRAAASTTAFDGKYIGVSRTSSKTGGRPDTECPPSAVPAPLTITNGVVLGFWDGRASPQGAVVMRNPNFSRVDARIDAQGTVTGQFNSPARTVTFVWRRQ